MKQHTKCLWGTTDSVGDTQCQKNYVFPEKSRKSMKIQNFKKLLKIYVGITIVKKHTKFHWAMTIIEYR